MYSFLSNFWSSLRRIDLNSSLHVWQNSLVKSRDPGLLLVWSFKINDSISSWVLLCLCLLFLPGSVRRNCTFLEFFCLWKLVHFFQLVYFIGIQLFIVIVFFISVELVVTSPFFSPHLFICAFFLFLMSLHNG